MESFIQDYFAKAIELLATVAQESAPAIEQAAQAVAAAIYDDKDFLLFGSGHSALIAQDAAGRAGGLMPALAMEDIAHGDAERIEGVARVILGRYVLIPGSAMVVISNSGINPVPIDMAMLARQAGLTVIAITSLAHSHSQKSRHSNGKKLYELADIVLDSHVPPGDAALEIPSSPIRTGAMSTILGSAIVQALTVRTVALLVERGLPAPVLISANVERGDQHNRELLAKYRQRLVKYQLSSYTP